MHARRRAFEAPAVNPPRLVSPARIGAWRTKRSRSPRPLASRGSRRRRSTAGSSAKVLPVKRGRWTRAIAAQARVVARMRDRGHSLNDLRQASRDGRLAFGYVEDLIPRSERTLLPKAGGRDVGARGGPDRSHHGPPRDADRRRGDADRAGRRCDEADRGRPRRRLPARRPASARPRLRAVDPQDRRGRGAPVPPLRPRAADRRGRRRPADGRGDGGPRPRPLPVGRAAHVLHPQPLPALLHRAGRRRPHGDRARRLAAARPGHDGVLLRRPHRASPASPRRRATRRPSTWSSGSSTPSRRRCPPRRSSSRRSATR